MSFIYAMSDIHGEIEAFGEALTAVDLQAKENQLILLGDYSGHDYKSTEAFSFVKNLQEQYKNQIIALMGNHEFTLLENIQNKAVSLDDKTIANWLKELPYYYETDAQIFVHAGVCEEAEEYWKLGSEDYYFCMKYPPEFGKFLKDIIAGHTGTCAITNDPNYHQVFWDKKSHFYIDGTTEKSKFIPVLKYDTVTKQYTSFRKHNQDSGFIWREYIVKRGKK